MEPATATNRDNPEFRVAGAKAADGAQRGACAAAASSRPPAHGAPDCAPAATLPTQAAHAFCPGFYHGTVTAPHDEKERPSGCTGGWQAACANGCAAQPPDGAQSLPPGASCSAFPPQPLPAAPLPREGAQFAALDASAASHYPSHLLAPQPQVPFCGLSALVQASVVEAESRRHVQAQSHSHRASVSFDQVMRLSHLPIDEAARELGVCTTVVKRVCRWNGVERWPFRKIQGLSRSIMSLQPAADAGTATRQQRLALARLVRRCAPLRACPCAMHADPVPLAHSNPEPKPQSSTPPPPLPPPTLFSAPPSCASASGWREVRTGATRATGRMSPRVPARAATWCSAAARHRRPSRLNRMASAWRSARRRRNLRCSRRGTQGSSSRRAHSRPYTRTACPAWWASRCTSCRPCRSCHSRSSRSTFSG